MEEGIAVQLKRVPDSALMTFKTSPENGGLTGRWNESTLKRNFWLSLFCAQLYLISSGFAAIVNPDEQTEARRHHTCSLFFECRFRRRAHFLTKAAR